MAIIKSNYSRIIFSVSSICFLIIISSFSGCLSNSEDPDQEEFYHYTLRIFCDGKGISKAIVPFLYNKTADIIESIEIPRIHLDHAINITVVDNLPLPGVLSNIGLQVYFTDSLKIRYTCEGRSSLTMCSAVDGLHIPWYDIYFENEFGYNGSVEIRGQNNDGFGFTNGLDHLENGWGSIPFKVWDYTEDRGEEYVPYKGTL